MTFTENDVTVVMCTANRNELSKLFIDYFIQTFPKSELIVIENSNEKINFEYLSRKYANYQKVRIFYSSPPGLSRARNFAIDKVKSNLIAFTDDDCLPDSDWLKSLASTKLWENADVVGGKILPIFPKHFDSTNLSEELFSSLAILDLGEKPRLLDLNENLVGANLCFKREIFNHYKFSESLGRVGNSLLSGEESDVLQEMMKKGIKIGYEPSAKVEHIVSQERLNPLWFLRRFAWQGVSDALSGNLNNSEWNKDALDYHSNNLGINKFIDNLFLNEFSNLDDRVKFARYLVYQLLQTDSENVIPLPFPAPYVPLRPKTKHIVFDYQNFHEFLAYSLPRDSISLVTSKFLPYELSTDDFEYIINDLRLKALGSSSALHLVFLTIDNILDQNLFPIFQKIFYSFEKVTVCLHRMPNRGQLDLLGKLNEKARILVFSKLIEEALRLEGIDITYVPIPIRKLNYEFGVNISYTSEVFRIAIAGEFRSKFQLEYLSSLLKFLHESHIQVTFRFIGGVRSDESLRAISELSKKWPGYIDNECLVKIKDKYQVIDNSKYYREISSCDSIFKLQFEENMAGSAVISDALSLGIPIITLLGTESARSIEQIYDDLIVNPHNHETFAKALHSLSNQKQTQTSDYCSQVNNDYLKLLLDENSP